jgi:hypothetical protein
MSPSRFDRRAYETMQNIWVLEFAFHLIKKIELGWLLGSQGRGADRHDNCSLLANHPEAG